MLFKIIICSAAAANERNFERHNSICSDDVKCRAIVFPRILRMRKIVYSLLFGLRTAKLSQWKDFHIKLFCKYDWLNLRLRPKKNFDRRSSSSMASDIELYFCFEKWMHLLREICSELTFHVRNMRKIRWSCVSVCRAEKRYDNERNVKTAE